MNIDDVILSYLDTNNISDIKDLIHILDHSFDGIVISNEDAQIFYVNQALERLLGIERSYFIGKNPREFKQDGLVLKVAKKISNENVTNIIQITKDGRIFLISSVPFHFKNKMFFYSNYREINELNNLQIELLQQQKDSTEFHFADELKEFINIFSSKDIIIKSPAMIKVIKTVTKIAKTDVTVNLNGESGVGKDVVAKLIHNLSGRKRKPFIQISCGLIPDNLFESELFGYSEGSFTGAIKKGKLGLLELANGGSIFFDEIGELSLNLQVKLLKVLQDQEIYRIGGRELIKLDVRFICATNKNLEKMLKEGKFREDLYFRINMIPIHIPPLRERKEDIIHLCDFFMKKYNSKHNTNKVLSIDVSNMIEAYSWPGNIRELKHLIERLVIISEGEKINMEDLPDWIFNKPIYSKTYDYNTTKLKDIITNMEKDVINEAIKKYGARKAAAVLGINYSTLKRKMRKSCSIEVSM